MRYKNMNLLRNRYMFNYEVYLISDLSDKPIYAGYGRAGRRAQNHLMNWGSNKLGYDKSELKIKYRVIVKTKGEAIDLEEKFIAQFNPEKNRAQRNTGVKGRIFTEEWRANLSKGQIKRYAK